MARAVRRLGSAGQATPEYVGVLLVVCAVLGGAASLAVAVPGVGERIVATVRTGLCIVGGDFCRTTDASAAGLAPCVTDRSSQRAETTLDIAVVRVGERGEWQLALQSDGQALVTRLEDDELGGTLGVGVQLSPAGVDAGVSASLVGKYHGGRAWRFSDVRTAEAFLEAAMNDGAPAASRAPDVRWQAFGGEAGASAGASLAGLATAGVTMSADAAIGLRSDGARRTLTVDLGATAPHVTSFLPGFPGPPGRRRSVVADVSWEEGQARELVLRSVTGDARRVDEYSVRLDLRDARSRALAEQLLRPGSTDADASALAEHAARHGIVERNSYTVSERRRGYTFAGRLGLALGIERQWVTAERRLVDAVAWVRGGPTQRRLDCLGA